MIGPGVSAYVEQVGDHGVLLFFQQFTVIITMDRNVCTIICCENCSVAWF